MALEIDAAMKKFLKATTTRKTYKKYKKFSLVHTQNYIDCTADCLWVIAGN